MLYVAHHWSERMTVNNIFSSLRITEGSDISGCALFKKSREGAEIKARNREYYLMYMIWAFTLKEKETAGENVE